MAGIVKVKDHVIWLSHITDDSELVVYLDNLKQGVRFHLCVDGSVGVWEKMKDAHRGVSTRGFKPIDEAKESWAYIYRDKVGMSVSISLDK